MVIVGCVLASLWLTAGPASACTCVRIDDDAAFASSSMVFVGTVLEKREPPGRTVPGDPGGRVFSSTDPATWVFAVERVYKGEVGDTQQVVSATSGASCGLELGPPGTRAIVFAAGGEQGRAGEHRSLPSASLCGGSRRLAVDAAAPPALPSRGNGVAGPALGGLVLLGLLATAGAVRADRA